MSKPTVEQKKALDDKAREFYQLAQSLGYYLTINLKHSDYFYPNGDRKPEEPVGK